jgi:hypothetical protein
MPDAIMNSSDATGGYLCGAVRYELHGLLRAIINCHYSRLSVRSGNASCIHLPLRAGHQPGFDEAAVAFFSYDQMVQDS